MKSVNEILKIANYCSDTQDDKQRKIKEKYMLAQTTLAQKYGHRGTFVSDASLDSVSCPNVGPQGVAIHYVQTGNVVPQGKGRGFVDNSNMGTNISTLKK